MRRGRSCAALRVLLLALCVTESAAPHHPAASPATAAEAAALEAALAQRSGPPAVAVKGVDEAWTAAPGGATQQHSPSSPAPPQPGLGGPRGECSPREAADGCHCACLSAGSSPCPHGSSPVMSSLSRSRARPSRADVRTEPACQNSEQRINCASCVPADMHSSALARLTRCLVLLFFAQTWSSTTAPWWPSSAQRRWQCSHYWRGW